MFMSKFVFRESMFPSDIDEQVRQTGFYEFRHDPVDEEPDNGEELISPSPMKPKRSATISNLTKNASSTPGVGTRENSFQEDVNMDRSFQD